MGCDFFYSGSLPGRDLQQKVIRLVQSYYSSDLFKLYRARYSMFDPDERCESELMLITPEPRLRCRTSFLSNELEDPAYPFDFYGLVPISDWLWEQGQFVFDRTARGKLVSFMQLPRRFNGLPSSDAALVCRASDDEIQVCIRDGGHRRLGKERWPFALLLNLIRLRYCPDLHVQDDFFVFDDVAKMLWKHRLISAMKDEDRSFEACIHLVDELEKWGECAEAKLFGSVSDKPLVKSYSDMESGPESVRPLRPVRDDEEDEKDN